MKYTDPKSKITVSSNGSKEGNEFLRDYIERCLGSQRKEKEWIQFLKSQGIKASHPDDGWNNREVKEILFAYCHFNEKPQIGDRIALGDYDKYRIVEIVGIRKSIMNQEYYQYKEI